MDDDEFYDVPRLNFKPSLGVIMLALGSWAFVLLVAGAVLTHLPQP